MSDAKAHVPVLLAETLEALKINADGCYIDGTFGRGGHSACLLDALSAEGSLIVFDKDTTAIEAAKKNFAGDQRLQLRHDSFANMARLGTEQDLFGKVDGVMLDLGVSSPQLDVAERGFSFSRNGPLDMRMNTAAGETAAAWLARVEKADLIRVLRDFGEEKLAKMIATKIIQYRSNKVLETTQQLSEIVRGCYSPQYKGVHPATRTFQAIRIHINQELDDLMQGLDDAFNLLAVGGRLAVISFHSLEDRIVKRFIRDTRVSHTPKHLPVIEQTTPYLKSIGKLVRPSEAECEENPRARSGRLRIAEKVMP